MFGEVSPLADGQLWFSDWGKGSHGNPNNLQRLDDLDGTVIPECEGQSVAFSTRVDGFIDSSSQLF